MVRSDQTQAVSVARRDARRARRQRVGARPLAPADDERGVAVAVYTDPRPRRSVNRRIHARLGGDGDPGVPGSGEGRGDGAAGRPVPRGGDLRRAAPAAPPTYLLLTLDYVPDILEKRDPYRADHLAGAKAQHDAGKCVIAGALQDPVDKGVFVFKDCDEAHVKAFVEADAYYKNGLVTGYTIRPWMIVVGAN